MIFRTAVVTRLRLFPVVADGERRADIHGSLGGRGFVVVLGLLVKINVGLVVVVLQKIRRFVETNSARGAGIVHVPDARDVFGKFACFIRHAIFLPEKHSASQCLLSVYVAGFKAGVSLEETAAPQVSLFLWWSRSFDCPRLDIG